jgi:septal ring factor EnvC (AmiA/AmiB activator)
MKAPQHLSQFQKDQYASYLESQLEKSGTFMLTQRKENEKYRHLEDMITQQHHSISNIKQQIELIEVYQHQNLQNCEHINKRLAKHEGF